MLDTEKTSTVGGTAVIDYLTCGSCLREFPLQKITAFIQHKKLDCDDENSESLVDPELQCNYCPRGFMTAWGLLVHAQLTHNLKIFLEKASRTFLEQSKMSYDPSQSQLYGSQFQILPSGYLQSDGNSTVSISGSLHSDRNVIVPISGSQQPDRKVVMPISVSLQPPACVRSTLPGMSNASQRSNMDLGKNICISTDCFTGNRNILAGLTGMEMSQTGKKVNNRVSLTDVNESEQLKNDKSVQIHQKIIAVPCQQIKTSFVDQISPPNVTDSGVEGIGPFRTRSNTLPNMSQIISNADSSRNIVSGQKTVDSESPAGDSMEFPQVISTDDPGKIHNFSCSSRASVNELIDGVIEVERGSLEELEAEKGTEGVSDTKFHKQGEALGSKATEIKQSTNISSDLVLDKNFVENQIDNLVTEKEAKDERSDDKEENRDDLDDVDRVEPCCDNLGCGITVIPGSHQTLQKCCNAVVPKKRKRHFETKHMPFSWSSSRYAKRRMLQSSRDRHFTSVSTTKSGYNMKTGSTIYIDVEPGTFVPDLEKPNSVESTQVKQSQSSVPKMASSERILTSQSKPRSLILRPGAVFSIPLTYTIPASNSTSVFMPAAVSQQLVASSSLVHSKSDNSETVSDPLESVVETTETVQQPSSQGSPVDNAVSDNSEGKPVLDGELRRRKYPTSKPFKCEVCEVAFNQRIHLKKHMSKHTGVKPYKCGQCDYSTVERSHLKVHIRIHTGEKPFKCTYCEYATAQNSTLKIHLKRHHGGRMFQCPNCSKEFTQQTQLNDHEWEHAPTDNSSKQTKLAVHKGVMKTGVVPDQSDQLEAAETITLETPVQQKEMTLDTAALSQTTSAISSTTGVGHVIPAGDRGIVVGNVTSGANSSADLGQVVPAASRIAVAGSETSGVNGSADLGQVVPAASRISVIGSETSGTNGSANLGHVVSAASRNIVSDSVTCEDTGSRDISHVVSVPEPSLTDNEAAVLLNSLTAKLLEESEKTSQSHLESLESVSK